LRASSRRADRCRPASSADIGQGGDGFGNEVLIDHAHTLLGLVVIRDSDLDLVAVLPKNERLGAELHPVGGPCFGTCLGVFRGAALVIDGGDGGSLPFDEIELRDETVCVARKRDRARVNTFGLLGREQLVFLAIVLLVPVCAVERIGVVSEQALHPFIEKETPAVDELVQHAGWQIVGHRQGRQRRARHSQSRAGERGRRRRFDHRHARLQD